jgi:hypothetical protein
MHGYPASDENMAAFLVAIGPSFSAQMVISEAHQLDIYPVVAQMLNLIVPATVVSDGGALRGVLLSAERK